MFLHNQEEEHDLVELAQHTPQSILDYLERRYMNDTIYTGVGHGIILAINPYQELQVYANDFIAAYSHRDNMPPHVYSIAQNAHEQLLGSNKNQAVIISGESGAGKTEATKQCLRFLSEKSNSVGTAGKRVLDSNHVLEAFGNAKTVRNDNSSRFGKFIQVFFNEEMTISGARNTNYLLEKVRVSSQNHGERNFHVFYQLCLGSWPELRASLGLNVPISSFRYLNRSSCIEVDTIDDFNNFMELEEALSILGISSADVFRVVALILHIGNLDFSDTGDRNCTLVCTNSGQTDSVEWTTRLLGVTRDQLARSLETTIFTSGRKGSLATGIGNSAETANALKDSLARFLYSMLFDWIVKAINNSIHSHSEHDVERCIGILDIFGFEIFEHNSFEQLCINYTNEALQNTFIRHTVADQMALYHDEDIDISQVSFTSHTHTVELISLKPLGIFHILDETIRLPQASDALFMNKLRRQHSSHPSFKSIVQYPEKFILVHFADTVEYDSAGFIEKSRDRFSNDLKALLWEQSTWDFLKSFRSDRFINGVANKESLGVQFAKQVEELVTTLQVMDPHYIRCIKPNTNKAAYDFNRPMVMDQVRSSGILSVLALRQQGYPFQPNFQEFCTRYFGVKPDSCPAGEGRDRVEALFRVMNDAPNGLQIGKTRVFYRREQHVVFEEHRKRALKFAVISFQSIVRGYLARRDCIEKLTGLIEKHTATFNSIALFRVLEITSRVFPRLPLISKANEFLLLLTSLETSISELYHLSVGEFTQEFREVTRNAELLGYHSDKLLDIQLRLQEYEMHHVQSPEEVDTHAIHIASNPTDDILVSISSIWGKDRPGYDLSDVMASLKGRLVHLEFYEHCLSSSLLSLASLNSGIKDDLHVMREMYSKVVKQCPAKKPLQSTTLSRLIHNVYPG